MAWRQLLLFCGLVACSTVSAQQVQFYSKDQNFGVAISYQTAQNGTEFFMQILAPSSFGWAAVGTGDQMDGSLMFIMYPSSDSEDVTLSTRSGHQHDTPQPISDVQVHPVESSVENGTMSATFSWIATDSVPKTSVDTSSSKQPWIWAVGPSQTVASEAQNAMIEQHSSYGTFFADMNTAERTNNSLPKVSNTSNHSTQALPKSYHALVVLHALILGFAFIVGFPTGVIGLRWRWSIGFGFHWIVQSVLVAGAVVGLAVAIAMSVISVQYREFDEGHQVLGLCLASLLVLQILAGFMHHRNFKSYGRRTKPSYIHIGLGRLLIYSGMINAVLGCILSQKTGYAVGCGIIALLFGCGMEFTSWWCRKRQKRKMYQNDADLSGSEIALNSQLGRQNLFD